MSKLGKVTTIIIGHVRKIGMVTKGCLKRLLPPTLTNFTVCRVGKLVSSSEKKGE